MCRSPFRRRRRGTWVLEPSGKSQINEPLGLGKKGVRGGPPRNWLQTGVVSALAIAIFAGSAAIAMRERPFRDTPQVAVSTPQQVQAEAPPEAAPAIQRDGPSIIRVNPQTEDTGSGVIVIRDPSTLSHDPRTAHLPDRSLLEDGAHGPLPIRAADGRRPFDAYARPWSGARGARVAIVIGGLGVSQTGTQTAISRLPPEVTLAFASGGNSLDRWMQDARREGHEVIMQVPLEPFDYPQVDPGRNTLTVDAAPEENLDRLHWALSRITNYVGITNYMGARFVADDAAMTPLMSELAARGLMYFDDGSSARSRAGELSRTLGVPYASSDMAIDTVRERGAVLQRLDELERTARAQGFAVATGSAFDVTIDAVATWISEARRRGIEIVPISALAHDPESTR